MATGEAPDVDSHPRPLPAKGEGRSKKPRLENAKDVEAALGDGSMMMISNGLFA
jgi:hypothetical protein